MWSRHQPGSFRPCSEGRTWLGLHLLDFWAAGELRGGVAAAERYGRRQRSAGPR